jgi:hypothetical protein
MMIDQIFSNADYYLNDKFITLMRNWNYYMNQEEIEDDKNLRQEIKNILVGDFYRAALEWLFSVDEKDRINYTSSTWRKGLE